MKRGAALVVVSLAVSGTAHAQGRAMPIEECVSVAIARNPDSLSADFEVDAAEAGRTGVRGELLPKLRAEGNLQEWNKPFNLPFALAPGQPPANFPVRDQLTWGFTATVTQPLTGLFNTLDRYKVERVGVDVARLKRDATRRDLGFNVAETYLRLLEAMRLDEVAKTSITQLEAQRKQAQSLLANGVVGKNDELRAELALANAKQREIQARGQVLLMRGRLAVLMGMPPDAPIEPMPFADEPPPATDDGTLEASQSRAVSERIEVRAVAQRIDQEEARVSAARSKLLPQVSGVGAYVHSEGSVFNLKDSAYVGAVASWDVWDWGTTTSGIDAAAARREQAKLAKTKLEDDVRLEARQAFVDLQTAREAFAVAKTALEQAEENYRIVTKRFEQAAGTSFDVVDAESLLTTARAQVENAKYGLLVTRLSLQRATGAMMPRVR
ncbi:MAG TPA: TolC family protein [Labilithrix sp.]